MAYHLQPNHSIAGHVERILVIDNYRVTTPFRLPLFANGSPTLLFSSAKGSIGNSAPAHLMLFGQTILPEILTLRESFTLIAYFFKPWALHAIFGIAAPDLTDKPIDLNLIAPKKTTELQERLLNEASVEDKLALVDRYILGLIADAKNDCQIIKYATTKLTGTTSREVLTTIQKELFLTERTFQRMFEKNIGIAPNLYRRIAQFNAAFWQLNSKRYDKLSDIAFRHGYADQSHYIRSFKEFTNLTPKDYINFGR